MSSGNNQCAFPQTITADVSSGAPVRAQSASGLSRIGDRFGLNNRSKVICRYFLAELLSSFGTLTSGFVDRHLGNRHVDDMTLSDATPFECIHVHFTPLQCDEFVHVETEKALPVSSGRAFLHLRAWQ